MKTNTKLTIGSTLAFVFFCLSRAFAQTNTMAAPDVSAASVEINVVSAAYHQLLNNPASVSVIPVLCVIAWLCDDVPFIDSKYVYHITVVFGSGIYWLYALPSSVPKSFPYPYVVLASNGILCGFIAAAIHKQAIARLIAIAKGRSAQVTCPNCGKPINS